MAITRLTREMVENIQAEVENLHREKPIWRNIFPVNPRGVPKLAHTKRYYELKDVEDGHFFYIKANASEQENAVTGYEAKTRDYMGLRRKWKIHQNDIEISNGQLRTDSILKITETMERQIELMLLSGGQVGGAAETGLLNATGVNDGTDGNGNGMSEIYGKVKELKDLLVEDHFTDRNKWLFIHDPTVDGYLDILHSTYPMTARKQLYENGILREANLRLTSNITPDSGDAAAALVEADSKNFYVEEPSNGIRVGTYYGGQLANDDCFHGYLWWAGVLVVVRPESVAQNTGIASA